MKKMKSQQFSYPYPTNEFTVTISGNEYLQIGIEDPYVKAKSSKDSSASIKINEKRYVINQNDILEFSGLKVQSLKIQILNTSNPYIIIDLAYAKMED